MVNYSPTMMKRALKTESGRAYLTRMYPQVIANYDLLIDKMGPDCPNALILLKFIWIQESSKDHFDDAIVTGDWPDG